MTHTVTVSMTVFQLIGSIGGILTIAVIVSGIAYQVLKGRFITRTECNALHESHRVEFCKKLEDIKLQLAMMEKSRAEARTLIHQQDVWLSDALRKIADQVGVDIDRMPSG